MQSEREPLLQNISPQDQEPEHADSIGVEINSLKGEAISSHEKIVGSSDNHYDHGVSMLNDNVLPTKSAVVEKTSTPNEQDSGSKVTPKTLMAAEGYLAVCGGCGGKVLFPLGLTRVGCVHCGAVNYMAPASIPQIPKKALLLCPNCKASILYTIGCTHFQCTCGCVIEIPIPDYYIPHFSK